MKILSIVGARPNFMKVAPLHQAFRRRPAIESRIVHTGQHYDANLSTIFMEQLGVREPDYFLNISSRTETGQTADILHTLEPVLRAEKPDWVVVVGDVTSTFAGALAAAQAGIRVAHVEAGLRSGDRQMPEERNRIQTDHLADLLFITEPAGLANLRQEGISAEKIHFVGNVLIDSLVTCRAQASRLDTVGALNLAPGQYILITLHRPANVDTEPGLRRLLQLVEAASQWKTVLFPLHPRTRASLARAGLLPKLTDLPNVRLLEPQGYLEFLNLLEQSAVVITDSGGVQEETTYLQVPCLTFRTTTERPITLELGTNQLIVDLAPATVHRKLAEILAGRGRVGQIPPLWDGRAAERIAEIISRF
ncbi:non-hydrolyzing UDP-N-acetylglucosamine 2-epimerase [Spirosoma koreense]